MRRIVGCLVAVFVLALLSVPLSAPPASAAPIDIGEKEAASYILVDSDTGSVIDARNAHVALPPASITKLLTALTVTSRVKPDAKITIATPNAQAMPALKIGVKQGDVWPVSDLLRGLLMVSANDAAVALAEEVSGTVPDFVAARQQAAKDLGLADAPVLNDPAGLDDTEFSNAGGDRVSARDMAIIARAALADPLIRSIVDDQRYDFTGPDGMPHHFLNHNGMLKSYPGAIGMKTGYTAKAHHTLVAAAQRNGRTMVAVVMGADSPNPIASKLLDEGFAMPVAAEPTTDVLALTSVKPAYAGDEVQVAKPAPVTAAASTSRSNTSSIVQSVAAFAIAALLVMRFRRPLVKAWQHRSSRELNGQLD